MLGSYFLFLCRRKNNKGLAIWSQNQTVHYNLCWIDRDLIYLFRQFLIFIQMCRIRGEYSGSLLENDIWNKGNVKIYTGRHLYLKKVIFSFVEIEAISSSWLLWLFIFILLIPLTFYFTVWKCMDIGIGFD